MKSSLFQQQSGAALTPSAVWCPVRRCRCPPQHHVHGEHRQQGPFRGCEHPPEQRLARR